MATVSIPSTSITSFRNSTAPIGWTKLTTDNDVAIRVTSGTTSSGGVNSFSSTFTTINPTGTISIIGFSLNTTTSTVAAHTHNSGRGSYGTTSGSPENMYSAPRYNFLYGPPGTLNTGATGGGTGHSHSGSISATVPAGSTLNFNVKYVDMIVAQRN